MKSRLLGLDKIVIKPKELKENNLVVADILINDRSLIEIIKEIEMPYAQKEGHPDIAGAYNGLPLVLISSPSKHLLGEPEPYLKWNDKIVILDCECCCYGCWSLVIDISITPDVVIWENFEQIHRTNNSAAGEWNYNNLRFVFNRKQYEESLNCEKIM